MNIEVLKNLDDLIKESKSSISNETLIKLAKNDKNTKFIGTINNSGDIENILTARKFLKPSSFYGHMYANNVSTTWNLRQSEGMDIFVTDSNGILKNSVNSDDAFLRIKKAKEQKIPIYYIFGGSTIMSLGSRIPNFSIPSLIERIFQKKYKSEIICVNFGLGGTSSQEALNIMIYKAFKLAKPSSVIFYDGWNCSTYLALINKLKKEDIKYENLTFFNGENIRNIEHNSILNSSYNLYWMLKRTLKLFLANSINLISNFFKIEILSKILNKIQSKYFSLKILNLNNTISEFNNISENEIKNMVPTIVSDYIDIHNYANQICKSHQIDFYWIFQPLVFYGEKKLNQNEITWKKKGLSSIQPKFYESFYEEFKKKNKSFVETKNINFHDLTNIFDGIVDQTYIDSGHLNRLGNLIVADKITDILKIKND
tara:strand:- start:555 stop:1838 length:1284 start_codon:yes stop_codon:yes gene_type:complete